LWWGSPFRAMDTSSRLHQWFAASPYDRIAKCFISDAKLPGRWSMPLRGSIHSLERDWAGGGVCKLMVWLQMSFGILRVQSL